MRSQRSYICLWKQYFEVLYKREITFLQNYAVLQTFWCLRLLIAEISLLKL